jgi:hypothetical protein
MRQFFASCLSLAVVACGGRVTVDPAQAVTVGDAGAAPASTSSGANSATTTAGGAVGEPVIISDERAPLLCDAVASAIAQKAASGGVSCTTVIRIRYAANAIAGYKMFCGNYASIDETAARMQAAHNAGISGALCATALTGERPSDEYVFYHEDSSNAACGCCGFGWVTAVSARNALTVLGRLGAGFTYPMSWDPPSDLGLECASAGLRAPSRGFDLRPSDVWPPPNLDASMLDRVLTTVWNTALPMGLERAHSLLDAVVLLYGLQAEGDEKAEWAIMLNSRHRE